MPSTRITRIAWVAVSRYAGSAIFGVSWFRLEGAARLLWYRGQVSGRERRSTRLLAASAALVVILFGLPAGVDAEASCLLSGDEREHLLCNLGLELWEEGRKSDKIFERWTLRCDLPKEGTPSCDLERELIGVWGKSTGAVVTTHRHSTSDRTLHVLILDVKQRKQLEFDVLYPGDGRMPVRVVLRQLFERLGIFRIESFEAKRVMRSVLSRTPVYQEWRIPDYDYIMSVPILMLGKGSQSDKERDELVRTLSMQDRRIFEHIRTERKCIAIDVWFKENPRMEEIITSITRRYEARLKELEAKGDFAGLSAQQGAIHAEWMARDDVRRFLGGKIDGCLRQAGMSPDGRRAVTAFLLRAFTGE